MEQNDKWLAIDAERTRIADLYETLTDVERTYPSLCDGWTVHDVATHVALAPHVGVGTVLKAALRARGNFNRMVYDLTKRESARLSPPEVVELLRTAVGMRRLAPRQSLDNALMDVHVHAQDIAMPLGRRLPMPAEAAVASADHLWEIGFPFHARKRLAGHRLIATDADWRAGEGTEVRGPIQALVMLLAGRTATIPQLTGI
ncbi:maleylpyruvate isomerase family mycothiol-dependent enzyme [Amycolatopsis tucumanensis]|uniref:Mycothiol-dependent maleylpyruvate isomerase metal-binding domain-containing protein n=1 Tax=Amycolatopsis tucumanensis TaxID=401106 RepID=A0ABP7IE71_9PSEU|nr:maleylpyruvate isomerase family mycothiol-dependent enzyme [Amycolatopsis tucumanensis]MCF6426857.1 maleylpyruvate isomerase family mycothiol-dependent enzyme [Amycolatopsis tucumanensis]